MPYIPQSDRDLLDTPEWQPETPGELNYVITQTVRQYVNEYGVSYSRLNDVIGVLEAVKLELYRRVVGPYEDLKIAENGDVYRITLLHEEADPCTNY